MEIRFGNGKTKYGPGVVIELDGFEIAIAVHAWLVAHRVHIDGSRTVTVNGSLLRMGQVYIDPSGSVIDPDGQRWTGRGKIEP